MLTKRSWRRSGVTIALAIIVLVGVLLTLSCSRDTAGPQTVNDGAVSASPNWGEPVGWVTAYGACKFFWMTDSTDEVGLNQTAVMWEYDGQGTLDLHHINANFNCCPEEIMCYMIFEDRTITITELETFDENGPCDCLCLTDVDFQVFSLSAGKYTVKVNELHFSTLSEPIEFEAILKGTGSSGTFVLDRCYYPWAECK